MALKGSNKNRVGKQGSLVIESSSLKEIAFFIIFGFWEKTTPPHTHTPPFLSLAVVMCSWSTTYKDVCVFYVFLEALVRRETFVRAYVYRMPLGLEAGVT